jgi:hypothetical protein
MNKILLLLLSLFLVVVSYGAVPAVVQADGCTAIDQSLQTYETSIPGLPHYCSIAQITRKVLNIAFTLIGGVSLLFIIIGGFRYITAGGNEESATEGKKTVLYAVVGLVVVLLAVTIVNVVVNLLLFNHIF